VCATASFAAPTNFGMGDSPASVAVGDFNGDSKPDLAVANGHSRKVSILLNNCTANTPPVAKCKDVTASAGASCTASASVDDGSSDPDSGDTLTLKQSPAGPYALGPTSLTLTVTDNDGASSSCSATVTVVDTTLPTISAPPPVTANTGAGATSCGVVVSDASLGGATVRDNCSVSTSRRGVPAGNLFPVGTTTLTYTATDEAGNTASATQPVTVSDTTPPALTLKPSLSLWTPNHSYSTLTTPPATTTATPSRTS
jgi:hypothetical protein